MVRAAVKKGPPSSCNCEGYVGQGGHRLMSSRWPATINRQSQFPPLLYHFLFSLRNISFSAENKTKWNEIKRKMFSTPTRHRPPPPSSITGTPTRMGEYGGMNNRSRWVTRTEGHRTTSSKRKKNSSSSQVKEGNAVFRSCSACYSLVVFRAVGRPETSSFFFKMLFQLCAMLCVCVCVCK